MMHGLESPVFQRLPSALPGCDFAGLTMIATTPDAFSLRHFISYPAPFAPFTPFSPPSGPATGSFNGLHNNSEFLAVHHSFVSDRRAFKGCRS